MENIDNIADGIDVRNGISEEYINKWGTVIEDLKNNYITSEKTISNVEAEKYRCDMEGLLLMLGVEREFIYPHIRINGYISSRDYKSDKTIIRFIDPQRLYIYKEMFKKK